MVPLDKVNQRNTAVFGYATWTYKVFSSQDGKPYTLRRIEGQHILQRLSLKVLIRTGYKLTNDKAVIAYKHWKNISNANVVACHEIFTTRSFQDSSLVFVTAFHPTAKTLAEHHQLGYHPLASRVQSRTPTQHVPESTLWQYMVQIANALRSIHGAGLAARIIDPSKILLTGPDQIRLNACGIKDVLDYGVERSVAELQREDFKQFGRLLVALGTNKASVQASLSNALDHFNRVYSASMKEWVFWLLNRPDQSEGIDHLLAGLYAESFKALDAQQVRMNLMEDQVQLMTSNDLSFRVMVKLNTVVDNPLRTIQYPNNGDRDPIKLLRDYIFHSVDEESKPVIHLPRMMECMQKLDAGVDEKIMLTSRDNQIILVVSYKELKQMLRSQFEEIMKQRGGHRN